MPSPALYFPNTPRHAGLSFPLLCLLCSAFMLLQSCTIPVGTSHVYKINHDNNGQLMNPLQPLKHEETDNALIYQTSPHHKKRGDDVFSIYLTEGYLKYLTDFGELNEVIIVAEFTEAVTGDSKKDHVVKILGPYNNVADATKPQLLNKLIYGPKRMESNVLNMKLQVFEYDRGENEDNAAMLDFIANAGEALGLANPVTLAEIAVAKEIGKSLIAANENDLVMTIDMDFVPGMPNMKWAANSKVHVLPLKAGEIVVIKQEACRPGTCFDYFSADRTDGWGLWADAVMYVPTALVRATTDTPDNNSLEPIHKDKIRVEEGYLRKTSSSAGSESNFTDKTWLRFAIVKGGDPSYWDQRKQLWDIEADFDAMIRQKVPLDSGIIKQMGEKLAEVENRRNQTSNEIIFSSKYVLDGTQYLNASYLTHTTCFTFPTDATKLKLTLPGFLITEASYPEGHHCLKLTRLQSDPISNNLLEVRYEQDGQPKAIHLPVKVVFSPAVSGVSCETKAGDSSTVTATVTNQELAISWTLYGQDYAFSPAKEKTSLRLPALDLGKHPLKLTTLFSDIDVEVNCTAAASG